MELISNLRINRFLDSMLISSHSNIRQQGLCQIKKSYLNHSDKFQKVVIWRLSFSEITILLLFLQFQLEQIYTRF